MVATPAIVVALGAYALFGSSEPSRELRWGFTEIWSSGAVIPVLCVGLLSQGTGVFGGLVLLDARANSFCVPVNRASSVLAWPTIAPALRPVAQFLQARATAAVSRRALQEPPRGGKGTPVAAHRPSGRNVT